LPSGSQELKQLVAMGYELDKTDETSKFSMASNGTNKILLSKNSERTAVLRVFTRKRELEEKEELELYEIVNKINTDLSYQISLGDDYLAVTLYEYGLYSPKTFSKLVRLIEKVDIIFDTYPKLSELLN